MDCPIDRPAPRLESPPSHPGRRRLLARALRLAWPAPWTLLGLLLALPALVLGARAQRVQGVLEVSGGRLGAWAASGVGPFGVTAVTLGHVILGCDAATLARLRAHEQVHVRQYERWGPLFVPAYLLSSLWQVLRGRHPYLDNGFERAARAGEPGL